MVEGVDAGVFAGADVVVVVIVFVGFKSVVTELSFFVTSSFRVVSGVVVFSVDLAASFAVAFVFPKIPERIVIKNDKNFNQ